MRKLIAMVLPLFLVMLCACSSDVSSTASSEKEGVSLTTSNYREYLNIEAQMGEVSEIDLLGTPIYKSVVRLNVYPIQGGTFSNVKMKVESSLPAGWRVDDGENSKTAVFNFTLPASGSFSKEIEIECWGIKLDGDSCYSTVNSISGFFVPLQ